MAKKEETKSVKKPSRPGRNGGSLNAGPGPGRPPGSISLASILKKRLAENPHEAEGVVAALIKHAIEGNAQMMKMVLDRVDGALLNTLAVNMTQTADLSKLTTEQLAMLESILPNDSDAG